MATKPFGTGRLLGVAAAAAAGLSAGAAMGQVSFTEVARIDISGSGIQEEPSTFIGQAIAVGYDGSRMFLAGFNNLPDPAQTGIIEVTNAGGAAGNVTGEFGGIFGQFGTPAFRGFSGLDLEGDRLTSSFDFGGASPNGIELWDVSGTPSNLQSVNILGRMGPSQDPGFEGAGGGVFFGSNGRNPGGLLDPATGDVLLEAGEGLDFTEESIGAQNRDSDFAPNGDLFVRADNFVTKTVRTGENTTATTVIIAEENNTQPFAVGQNIEFMEVEGTGGVIIYNDRATGAPGQAFGNVVKVIDPDGNAVDATFSFLGDETLPDGGAAFDFDYDPVSQTLAVLHFDNRSVSLFQVAGPGGGLVGDLNGDGFVGAGDLDILLGVWNQNVEVGSTPDLNDDGFVGAGDLDLLLGNWNAGTAPTPTAGVVPEPASVALLGLGGLALLSRRRGA